MSDHKYTCPDCGRLYVCDEGDQDPPCCNREWLRARVAVLEAALIDARDTFAGDEDDDRYWAWFNRHEDGAFAGMPETAGRNADRSGDEIADRCEVCGQALTWEHDHKPDLSGLDDGPPLPGARSRPQPKSPDELRDIRARAWATRRQKYGDYGHR